MPITHNQYIIDTMNYELLDKAIKSMWEAEVSSFRELLNEDNNIEELLTTLHNEPEEEAITEKWIDYATYQLEKIYEWQNIIVYATKSSSL